MERRRDHSLPRQLRVCARVGAEGRKIPMFQSKEAGHGQWREVVRYKGLAMAFGGEC